VKALLIEKPGSLDNLKLGEIPRPDPGPRDVLIRVHAAGVNPADWKIVERGVDSWALPIPAGLDAAGIVTSVGSEVADFAVGDRVCYHGSWLGLGAYAEYAAAPSHVVAKLPDGVSFEQAAVIPTAGYTAMLAIDDVMRPGPDDTILIHAGAGGLGGFAIQLAKRRGACVIVTCSAENNAFVTGLGADYAIDYRNDDVTARVRELTAGRGVDAVLDTIGTQQVRAEAIGMLAFQGWLLMFNGVPNFTELPQMPRGMRIADIALGAAYVAGDARAQRRMAHYGEAMAALIASNEIDPMIEHIYSFEQAVDALRRNRTGHQRGRVVIRVE